MRRFLSSFLIALFSFTLIAQVISVQPAQNLPACCRRAGAHHCAMPGGAVHQESGAQLNATHCPLFPQAGIVSQGSRFTAPAVPFLLSVTHFSGLTAPPDSRPGYQVSQCGSIKKRGPPSLA
jgi:hypothetical protein